MDLFSPDALRWFFAAWFALLGGMVGSFLNVVVYRLPAGLNIAWPPSHCPACKRPIRAYDNVPVLAWLWLRGRCRDCRSPISARYPLVEALTAGLFALLFFVEVLRNAQNLPPRNPPSSYTLALALCFFHIGLLLTLLVSALITLDGHRPPWRLFAPMLVVGLLAPVAYPWLHPQAVAPAATGYFWSGALDGLVGLAVGFCLGSAAIRLGRRTAGGGQTGYRILGESVLLGVALGWQAVILLVAAAMILETLTRLAATRCPGLRRATAAVWLSPLALLWILNWANIAALWR